MKDTRKEAKLVKLAEYEFPMSVKMGLQHVLCLT